MPISAKRQQSGGRPRIGGPRFVHCHKHILVLNQARDYHLSPVMKIMPMQTGARTLQTHSQA